MDSQEVNVFKFSLSNSVRGKWGLCRRPRSLLEPSDRSLSYGVLDMLLSTLVVARPILYKFLMQAISEALERAGHRYGSTNCGVILTKTVAIDSSREFLIGREVVRL